MEGDEKALNFSILLSKLNSCNRFFLEQPLTAIVSNDNKKSKIFP